MKTETETYCDYFSYHLGQLIERLRQIPSDKWDWMPTPSAPSSRLIAEHAWLWLVSDRQHVLEADATRHPLVPDAPMDQQGLCDLLEQERKAWWDFLPTLTPERMAERRLQFGTMPRNIRYVVAHITQQIIYKHGQLSTLFFALGLEEAGPYEGPSPNRPYEQLQEAMRHPLHRAVLSRNREAVAGELSRGHDLSQPSATGDTPLKLAVLQDEAFMVRQLLAAGADGDEADLDGNTLLIYACYNDCTAAAQALIAHGVNVNQRNRWQGTALGFAQMRNAETLIALLTQAGATP